MIRRDFLRSIVALAAAPAMAGFFVKPLSRAITPEAYLSVKSFGAIGDGIADDSQAIRTAVRAATQFGVGRVFFPAGTYRIEALP